MLHLGALFLSNYYVYVLSTWSGPSIPIKHIFHVIKYLIPSSWFLDCVFLVWWVDDVFELYGWLGEHSMAVVTRFGRSSNQLARVHPNSSFVAQKLKSLFIQFPCFIWGTNIPLPLLNLCMCYLFIKMFTGAIYFTVTHNYTLWHDLWYYKNSYSTITVLKTVTFYMSIPLNYPFKVNNMNLTKIVSVLSFSCDNSELDLQFIFIANLPYPGSLEVCVCLCVYVPRGLVHAESSFLKKRICWPN